MKPHELNFIKKQIIVCTSREQQSDSTVFQEKAAQTLHLWGSFFGPVFVHQPSSAGGSDAVLVRAAGDGSCQRTARGRGCSGSDQTGDPAHNNPLFNHSFIYKTAALRNGKHPNMQLKAMRMMEFLLNPLNRCS